MMDSWRKILQRWRQSGLGDRSPSSLPGNQSYHRGLIFLGLGVLSFWIAIGLAGMAQSVCYSPAHPLAPSPAQTAKLTPQPSTTVAAPSGAILFDQGQQAFDAGDVEVALALWQQAIASEDAQVNPVFQVVVLNSVAIAHQRLNQWDAAQSPIAEAVQQLNHIPDQDTVDLLQAQLLNTRGRSEWFLGRVDAALLTWEQASNLYQTTGDVEGFMGSQMNQVQAMETLGYYRQACNKVLDTLAIAQTCDTLGQPQRIGGDTVAMSDEVIASLLAQLENQLNQQLDYRASRQLQVLSFRSLGNLLRLTGRLDLAQQILEQGLAIAASLPSQQQVLTQLSLAATQRDQFLRMQQLFQRTKLPGDRTRTAEAASQTLELYDQVIAASADIDAIAHLQAQLQHLGVLINLATWNQQADQDPELQTIVPSDSDVGRLNATIAPQVAALLQQLQRPSPSSRVTVNAHLDLAQQLLQLQRLQPGQDWLPQAEGVATAAVKQADQLSDRRSQSYAYGILGQVYENQGNNNREAQDLTRKALSLSQASQTPEMTYRWQWQLGRLADQQQNAEEAIAYYEAAVQTLDAVRNNLLGIDAEVQFSFRDDVEPIYRRLVELLLTQGEQPPSQATLQRAIRDIDALQLSELENFLGCNLAESVAISETLVDPTAAIIYPIILPQQLAVITKFPQTNDLHLHTIEIDATNLETRLNSLRRELARPYRSGTGLQVSQNLYDWLIRPIQPLLAETQAMTLVFVLDGKFRNVPMATLHNGETYLIQDYALALMPGLQLIEPQPLSATSLDVLTFGLSQMRQEFPPHAGFVDLMNVEAEVNEIQTQLPSRLFLNQDFTQAAMAKQVEAIAAPIVHLATHGQFSSDPADTFVLAWDRRIDINDLSAILQSRNGEANPIELLVLSACKTAEGDDRAALGLAGIAVRSGARSTLASLWTVDDQATAEMMSLFYQELAQAEAPIAKAEALRRAQVKLLETESYKAPRYWAPFILVGNWL
ncbi:MAG: CHAT domain-containing protein [Leptolyngbyaceae cyanobacterium]